MNPRALLTFVSTAAVLAACSGTPPGGALEDPSGSSSSSASTGEGGASGVGGSTAVSTGSGTASAKEYFELNVSPIVDTACASCHSAEYQDAYASPDFLGASLSDYYDMLVGNIKYVNASPGNSQFLTKGLHTGPAFTESEDAIVTTWLQMEADDRFGGGSSSSSSSASVGSGGAGGEGGGGVVNPTDLTGQEAAEAFGDCMTLEDWKASGIHMVATQSTLTDGPCNKCHQSGSGANYMTSPANEASIQDGFENMRYGAPALKLITWTIDPVTGGFLDIVQSQRWQKKGGEGTGHPKYVMSSANLQAIDDWFDLAYASWQSGACGGVPGGP